MKTNWLVTAKAISGEVVAWFYVSQRESGVLDDDALFDFCVRSGIPGDKWVFQIFTQLGEVGLGGSDILPTFKSPYADFWFLGIPTSTNVH